jgi:hypothetical protein
MLVMRIASKALAYVLLGWALLAPLAGPLPPHAPAPAPAAGCHHHGQKPSVPQPASYRCCLSGHNVAILQTSNVEKLAVLHIASPAAVPESLTGQALPDELSNVLVPPGDPPGIFALRI